MTTPQETDNHHAPQPRARIGPMWRVLLPIAGLASALLVSFMVAAVAQAFNAPPWSVLVMSLAGTSAAALGAVYLMQRFIDRRPTAMPTGVGGRRSIPLFLLGTAAAFVVMVIAKQLTVMLGIEEWVPIDAPPGELIVMLAIQLVVITAGQAFPEELLWRGYLADSLSRVWSPGAVIIATSVSFGALHVISNPGAEASAADRLLYAAMAVSFGFALIACRLKSQEIWLAVGFHAGHNLTVGTLTNDPYGPRLIVHLVVLAAFGALMLLLWHRRRPVHPNTSQHEETPPEQPRTH